MYELKFSARAFKALSKLDQQTQKLIKNWLISNLVNTLDPRTKGKALQGNLKGLWRYRIGDYRLIAEIRDREFLIILLELAHRSEIYRK